MYFKMYLLKSEELISRSSILDNITYICFVFNGIINSKIYQRSFSNFPSISRTIKAWIDAYRKSITQSYIFKESFWWFTHIPFYKAIKGSKRYSTNIRWYRSNRYEEKFKLHTYLHIMDESDFPDHYSVFSSYHSKYHYLHQNQRFWKKKSRKWGLTIPTKSYFS